MILIVGRFAMSVSLRSRAALALAGLAALTISAPPVWAQGRGIQPNTIAAQSGFNLVRPNPRFILPSGMPINQAAFNIATLGTAASFVPPYALGFNPYPQVANYGPVIGPTIAPYSPALSTLGGGNPYLSTGYGAGLATDPSGGAYSLSTTGSPAGYSPYGYPYYGYGNGGYGWGMGTPASQDIYAYAGYLRGAADLTAATGKYWKDIQQARISREQSRQMALETQRRRIMDEAAYERMKPTALDLYTRSQAASLDWARKDPPATFIWSGQALNDLLRSVGNSGDKLSRGPNIPLEDETLKGINLTDGSSRGNIGLLKDGGKVNWPLPLLENQYDEARKRLSKNLMWAVQQLKEKDPLDKSTLRDIQADYKTLNERLAASVSDLSPSQYIESRRFLNQLGEAVRALEDPKAGNYFSSWSPKGKNVAELLNHMLKEGLKFAPATGGDEASYRSLYQALKAYEAGIQAASRGS
jgi:hypothetical protein